MPKYYEISEAAARRAKDMNSYSDYAPGSATAGYRAMVDEAYALAERQKAQVDPMYHDKIDALVDRYARRLAENLNERNAIDARVPSIDNPLDEPQFAFVERIKLNIDPLLCGFIGSHVGIKVFVHGDTEHGYHLVKGV